MTKRVFDIVASLVGLVVLSPLLLTISVIVKMSSPGPVLYKANRVGKDGELFQL